MKVRRGEKRYNLYEPEFAAIGRTSEPTERVNLDDESSKLSQVLPPDESTFSPDESSGLDSNKRNKSNKNITNEKNLSEIKVKADLKVNAILEQEAKTQEAAKTGKFYQLIQQVKQDIPKN
jgi:hypothetical protein